MENAEQRRLAALFDLGLVDTAPEEDFDRLVRLTARLFQAPMAMISLLERNRQFLKARVGINVCETDIAQSFCAWTILGKNVLIVPDAALDDRFRDFPYVTGPPNVRFYAGAPLFLHTGEAVGTLCVLDSEPREDFSEADVALLEDCAALVVSRMEMRRLDYLRRVSQERLRSISSSSPDAVICTDQHGEITFWNGAAERLFGYAAAEVVGTSVDIIVPNAMRGGHSGGMARVAKGGDPHLVGTTVELVAQHRDGREFPIELSLSMWAEDDAFSFGAIIRDITLRRQHETRLFQLARMDPLTGLTNRAELISKLDDAISANLHAALLILDLDGFKEVNDTMGHLAGDQALREVADRLRTLVPETDTVARLGGDEFVVLVTGHKSAEMLHELSRGIIADLNEPILTETHRIELGVSVGIALFPEHARSSEELLAAADLALYCAKADGRNLHRLFRPSFRQATLRRRRLEAELRTALERNQFRMFYQPLVRLSDGEIVGGEALIRWQHPSRGLLMPGDFLPVLETGPLAARVGTWTLQTACRQAAIWRRTLPDFRIGVNLFGAQFSSGDLVEVVRGVLADTGIPADALELEITENIILRQDRALLEPLGHLHRMGVSIAFDDYGTGYASLSLLKRYPLSRLKIDRSFVRGVTTDEHDAAIVKAVISLAKAFGLCITGEGVETAEEHRFLRNHGCDIGQGYLYGRPVAAEDFGVIIRGWEARKVA